MLVRERIVSASDSTSPNAPVTTGVTADLMVGLGGIFAAAGMGIAATASRR